MAEPLSPFVAWLHKMMRYLPHLAIVASLLVYAFFIFTERYSSIFNLSLYLIPLIGISIVLIVNKKFSCDDSVALFNISFKRLRNAHLIIFALTIICLGFGHDGWVYLALMFVQYCLLLAQLFAKDQSAKWIVVVIMLTTSILVLPQMLIPAYYCGDGDLLFHAGYAKTIIDMGTVATGYGGVYESFNAYHILIAAFAEATGLAINVSLYLVSTAAVLFSVPIVYALAKFFAKSERIAAFSAFFYALLPMVLDSMLIPAPRVMASMAFFLIVYMLFKHLAANRWRAIILSSILICYMVLVHHAQLIFIAAVTAGLLFGVLLYAKKLNWKMIVGGLVVLAVPVYVLVTRYSSTLTSIIQNRLLGQIEGGNLSDIVIESTANAEMSVIEQLLSINFTHTLTVLASSVIIVFVFAGLYALLRNITVRKKICVILPLVLVTFVVFVPGIVDLFPTISDSFQIYRFRFVLSLFFAVIMGIGCLVLLNLSTEKKKKAVSCVVVIGLCLLLITSSAIPSSTIIDNTRTPFDPILKETNIRALDFIQETASSNTNSKFYSDYEHTRYVDDVLIVDTPFSLASYHIYQLFITLGSNINKPSYLLYPYEKHNNSGIIVFNGYNKYSESEDHRVSSNTISTFTMNTYTYGAIYENNLDRIYLNA